MKEDMEKPLIQISVRNLVEFIFRSGDLDNRRGTSDKEAMQKGSRLHRKIQKSMGSSYRAEVALKHQTEYEDLVLCVEGRADGIFEEKDQIIIDEIKGIYRKPELLEEPYFVHKAQAMCYAYIYAEKQELSEIQIQMTYAQLDTEETKRFREVFSFKELEVWYRKLLKEYHKWISWQQKWKEMRNTSAGSLQFPFSYRDGQRKMVSSVYHAISEEKQIFIQAPTGVGKTMSTVFPTVRLVGEDKVEKIFYLTARTITRTVAEEAFHILRENGLKLKVITLTAKEKMCFCEKTECNPEACPYAKGHFDRINDAVFELWTTESVYTREVIQNHALKWQVCPFEFSLDLSTWADAVICDYNYVFDPNAHLKRFFGEGAKGDYAFLIDEAHNLVERGREMYSAKLCKEDILALRKNVRTKYPALFKALGKLNKFLVGLKQTCETYEVLQNQGSIPLILLQVMGEMEKILEDPEKEPVSDEFLDFYFCARDFQNISELVDEHYVIYTENQEDGKFYVRLYCVDPSANLEKYLEKGRSAVFFSATLLPMLYYKKLLSTRADDYGIYVPSPFEREKRCILIGSDVSSRYTRRNYTEYRRIAEYIARMIWQKKGNYMVFFPSYRFMEDVYQVYEEEFSVDWVRCICQKSEMNEKEKEEFLRAFQQQEQMLVGFCVMGGIFSEGIDLSGKQLIGAVIIGTGIPQVSNEKEILKKYYDDKKEDGFNYAYRYPGMNKVLQAAGRVIRTQEDEGVILLLDDRFLTRDHTSMFPVEWEDRERCNLSTIEKKIQLFWKGREGL